MFPVTATWVNAWRLRMYFSIALQHKLWKRFSENRAAPFEMASRIWGSLCDPPGSNAQPNFLFVLYPTGKHTAVSLWLSRHQDPRVRHGAEVLTRKEKNRQRFVLYQPLPWTSPATQACVCAAVQFCHHPATREATCSSEKAQDGDQVPQGRVASWAAPGVVWSRGASLCSLTMTWSFPKSLGSSGHTGMEGEPSNPLTQQHNHTASRFFFLQIYPLYLFI